MACPLQSGVFPQHICNVLLDCTSGAGKHKPALCYWTAPAPVGIRKVHITSAAHADTKLNDIMKLELLEGKTADEIEHLWMTVSAADLPLGWATHTGNRELCPRYYSVEQVLQTP